jgi:FkbM family methyltransferase
LDKGERIFINPSSPMRIWSSIRWRALALARACGYRGNPCLFGVEVPLALVPSRNVLGQLDALSYEAKEARYIQAYLPAGAEVLELGASLGIVSSIILGCRPSRLISYEAVGPLTEVARQVVAHNHPSAPWTLVHCAIAGEGVAEVSFDWSPAHTQGGSVAAEPAKSHLRVPAESLAAAIARHQLSTSAWLVMDIEGMEWEIARHQAAALGHFAGIIVECHDVKDGDRHVSHAQVLAELALAGFEIAARRGQVSVLLRRAA